MTKPKPNPQKAGRKKTLVPFGKFDVPSKAAKRKVTVNFTDRAQAETYVQRTLTELAHEYDDLASGMKIIIAGLTNAIKKQADSESGDVDGSLLRMLEQREQRYRQVLQDKARLVGQLMKQFELLTQLDKPIGDDPRFTPVDLNLNTEPPADAYQESGFTLDADDIQPDAGV